MTRRGPKSTAIRFAKGDGSFSIGEFGWLPEAGQRQVQGSRQSRDRTLGLQRESE
jgi:hypothetical protein